MTAALLAAVLELSPKLPRETAMEIAAAAGYHAHRFKLDAFLVVALAFRESSFRPDARNERTGALGLMQIAPVNRYGLDDAEVTDIHMNIGLGCQILAVYIRRHRTTEAALSRYNGLAPVPSSFSRDVMALLWRIEKHRRKAA